MIPLSLKTLCSRLLKAISMGSHTIISNYSSYTYHIFILASDSSSEHNLQDPHLVIIFVILSLFCSFLAVTLSSVHTWRLLFLLYILDNHSTFLPLLTVLFLLYIQVLKNHSIFYTDLTKQLLLLYILPITPPDVCTDSEIGWWSRSTCSRATRVGFLQLS